LRYVVFCSGLIIDFFGFYLYLTLSNIVCVEKDSKIEHFVNRHFNRGFLIQKKPSFYGL